jgi:hypothetical protein
MRASVQTNRRAQQRPGADSDPASIDHGAVEVDKHVLAEVDIGAVVGMKRGFDPGVAVQLVLRRVFGDPRLAYDAFI